MRLHQALLLCAASTFFNVSHCLPQELPESITAPSIAVATATQSNGLLIDANPTTAMASLAFSISGEDALPTNTGLASPSSNVPDSSIYGSESQSQSQSDKRLPLPAILGIVLGAILAFLAMMAVGVYFYMRRRQQVELTRSRSRRKSIMDKEFGRESRFYLPTKPVDPLPSVTKLSKPLPTLTYTRPSDDFSNSSRLSTSSTIIAAADAAEIAQINRKMSEHQQKERKQKKANGDQPTSAVGGKQLREMAKEQDRDNALRILITNESETEQDEESARASEEMQRDQPEQPEKIVRQSRAVSAHMRRDSIPSPLAGNPNFTMMFSNDQSPTTLNSNGCPGSPTRMCPDNDGDLFEKRPSRI